MITQEEVFSERAPPYRRSKETLDKIEADY